MNNEQILKERWEKIDKLLMSYLKRYKKVNRKTRDKIQDIFNNFDMEYQDLNKTIPKKKKDRLDRFLLVLKEKRLLTGYFGYKARLILIKSRITYAEMLEIMIEGAYIEENEEIKQVNKDLFFYACEETYNQGIKDIEKTKKVKHRKFDFSVFYTLLNIPILNATAESYLQSLALSNANELYKYTLTNIQLRKELDVDNNFYIDLFNKQNNRLISINEDKMSGGIVNIVENLSNLAYLQAGKDNKVKQCRFIAEMDNKTTKMCDTLNNQLFYLDKYNTYQRYSAIDKRIVTYTTKGLIQGENLPPINNHFHWCRSTITYQTNLTSNDFQKK